MPNATNEVRSVRLLDWPERPAVLEHRLAARELVPVCIKVCEPICAQSEYTIGIDVFDRPVVSITVRGITRLFNCDEKR